MKRFRIENFKRFENLDIQFQTNELILWGPNGSGKTQILWAMLLFFRGYNLGKEGKPIQIRREIARLINHSEYRDLPNYNSFIYKFEPGQARLYGSFETEEEIKVVLQANGILELHSSENHNFSSKIAFAFMGSTYHFSHEETHFTSDTPINSSSNALKQLYQLLDSQVVDELNDILLKLFGVSMLSSSKEENNLFVIDANFIVTDVMFCGSGLQKTIATFILLFYLSSRKNPIKYFFLEEPESMLYPSLTLQYFEFVREICQRYQIHLVMTTNSKEIVDYARKESLFHLSGESGVVSEANMKILLGFINEQCQKEASDIKLLVVDGPTDSEFFKQMLPPDLLSSYNIVSFGSQCNAEFMKFLGTHLGGNLHYIKDREFLLPTIVERYELNVLPAKGLHLDLPCIESYKLLYHLERQDITRDKVKSYFQTLQAAIDFSNGIDQNKVRMKNKPKNQANENQVLIPEDLAKLKENMWAKCIEEVNKPDPDWLIVVQHMHGLHSVDYFKVYNKDLFRSFDLNTPVVKGLLEKLFSKLTALNSPVNVQLSDNLSSHQDDSKI